MNKAQQMRELAEENKSIAKVNGMRNVLKDIEYAAENGKFSIRIALSKKQIDKLISLGFSVTDTTSLALVSW